MIFRNVGKNVKSNEKEFVKSVTTLRNEYYSNSIHYLYVAVGDDDVMNKVNSVIVEFTKKDDTINIIDSNLENEINMFMSTVMNMARNYNIPQFKIIVNNLDLMCEINDALISLTEECA